MAGGGDECFAQPCRQRAEQRQCFGHTWSVPGAQIEGGDFAKVVALMQEHAATVAIPDERAKGKMITLSRQTLRGG